MRKAKSKLLALLISLLLISSGFFIYSTYLCDPTIDTPPINLLFAKDNITIVKDIIQRYNRDHTYSKKDLFVCSDMATDVWNMIKSKGFDAKIKIGNIDNETTNKKLNFTQYNHAWVMAEIDNEWYALETTAGFIAEENKHPLYYRKTIEFNNALEFKDYLDSIKQYNTLIIVNNNVSYLCNALYTNYTIQYDQHNALIDTWNKKYSGTPSSTESDLFSKRIEDKKTTLDEKENTYNGCIVAVKEIQKLTTTTYKKIESKNK
ncbi:MAG: hypothetical protein KAR87_00835 [Candidatus Aenigmarchaeota archaeon]|nr:hypothetical protein [Candidatus Aenigmarchaeota archaeon]